MVFRFSVFCCILFLHVFGDVSISQRYKLTKPYINEFFLKLSDENKLPEVQDIAETLKLHLLRKILTRLYLFRKKDLPDTSETPEPEEEISSWMKAFGNLIEYIKQDRYQQVFIYRDVEYPKSERKKQKVGIVGNVESEDYTEDYSALENTEESVVSTPRWVSHYTEDLNGKRIKIAVLDAAFDTDHHNLKNNIRKDMAYNFVDRNDKTKPDELSDEYLEVDDPYLYSILSHGTKCMGRIASTAEYGCSRGGDISANIIPLRFLNDYGMKRDKDEIDALSYKNDEIDIYSCSFGDRDNFGFSRQDIDIETALADGVSKGRSCKGCIYLFPSGNGNANGKLDNCNADMYASSVNTITISSVTMSDEIAEETEACPCTLVATYGSPDPPAKRFMNTTEPNNKCTSHFRGTSAATAYAAGMISHALKGNYNLSKRDIEHLLVHTANTHLHPSVKWRRNGAHFWFNDKIGFGAIDLDALKVAAKDWPYVPEKHTCVVEKDGLGGFMNDTSYTSEFKMSVTACYGTKDYVKYLEHTQIELELSCSNISEISINLISPRRTKVSLLTKVNTSRVAYTNLQWTFMTVHFWGEDPEGVWRLNLVANSIQNVESTIRIKKLILHGTEKYPSSGGQQQSCDKDIPKPSAVIIVLSVVAIICFVMLLAVTVYCVWRRCKGRSQPTHCCVRDSGPDGNRLEDIEQHEVLIAEGFNTFI